MLRSVIEQLAKFSKTQPDNVALVAQNKQLTYAELYAFSCGFCDYLIQSGIKKEDFVICRASASLAYWISYLGIQLAGGIVVPLEKDYSNETLYSTADSLKRVFAIISTEGDDKVAEHSGCKFIPVSLVTEQAKKCFAPAKVRNFPEDYETGQIIFTTGTTGKAKGVMIPHKYIVRSAFGSDIPYCSKTIMVLPAPMNHILAIGRCTCILLHGGTVVLLDGLTDMEIFYDALALHKANAMALTPSALNHIIALTGEEFVKYRSQISFIEIGGEKLPRRQQSEFIELLPAVRMFIVYASTETGMSCSYEFSRHGATDNRIGKPVPFTNICFLDENWKESKASPDNPGFIAVQSYSHMKGYWNDDAATDSIMRGDLIKMSDYGYTDDEGFVCLAGRAGDVIISGGHKINPTDVENTALGSGIIADCVCIGQKNELFGKLIKLLVVMKEGEEFDRFAINKYLVNHLEGFKVPKIIECVDKIMRNKNGKIDRRFYTEQ